MKKLLIMVGLSAALLASNAMAIQWRDQVAAAAKPKIELNGLASCTTFTNNVFSTVAYQCCTPSSATSGAPKAAWYPTSASAPVCPKTTNGVSYAAASACSIKTPVQTLSSSSVNTSWLPGNTATSSCLIIATT